MNNLVSIITPVYNSEKFLRECIESVLSQTHDNWEHILVDDGSIDNSAVVIEEQAENDPRIKYIRLAENSGAGMARNRAIEVAKGDFIAFLDSDDRWYPEKLAKQLFFMQQNQYPFTFTSYHKMDRKGKKILKEIRAKERVSYQFALYKNPIGCLTVIYDVRFFGKQYMPVMRKRQDYALWLRLLKQTDAYGLEECLSCYRVRYNSVSFNKLRLIRYEWKVYREVEKLSLLKSLFYTLSAIILKMKSYF